MPRLGPLRWFIEKSKMHARHQRIKLAKSLISRTRWPDLERHHRHPISSASTVLSPVSLQRTPSEPFEKVRLKHIEQMAPYAFEPVRPGTDSRLKM
jgi:hypothetical protein